MREGSYQTFNNLFSVPKKDVVGLLMRVLLINSSDLRRSCIPTKLMPYSVPFFE